MSTKPAWIEDDDFDEVGVDFDDEDSPAPRPYCEFLTGSSGTGKSYEINRRIREDRSYALLCATTGIAAVNLGEGVTTINSALKYFKTENLEDAYINGRLTSRLKKIASMGYRNIVIDEVSMMAAQQLDIIVRALDDLSTYKTIKHPLGLVLTGDFCLGLGTKVMMADGSLKAVEEIQVGDQVMGPDSKPRNVLRTTSGEDEMYCVDQTNGDSYIVNSRHSLALKRSPDGKRLDNGWLRYPKHSDAITMQASELATKSNKFRECFVGYKAGLVDLPERSVPIDPYFLGVWLGDGDSESQRITTADSEVLEYCQDYAKRLGMSVTKSGWARTEAVRVRLTSGRNNRPNLLLSELRKFDLISNKHIPADYLLNSERKRLQLLAGLLDSDGCWGDNRYQIAVTIESLARDIKQLADQLGFRTHIRQVTHGYYKNNSNSAAWNVTIGGDTWRIPCLIARKQSKPRSLGRSRLTSVLKVTPIGRGNYAGFEIDGDHLFLLADGTVTHNCQLPPVKARWAFEADCWERFESNTIRLTKYWRQSNAEFQAALLAMRQGDGPSSVDLLDACGVEYASNNALDFNGTTIMGTNNEVDRFNWLCHSKLVGRKTVTQSIRWGRQLSEWKHIPERLELKIGAYVMILANAKENAYSEDFLYVNGDCGEVVDIDGSSATYLIRLKRSGRIVPVVAVTRCNEQKERPAEDIEAARVEGTIEPFFDSEKKRWVVGAITYLPLRLAYASTCHKVQGITLDAVQINLGHAFFGSPSMCYVALSRCREASGLRIVGNRELLAKRVCTDPKVQQFL